VLICDCLLYAGGLDVLDVAQGVFMLSCQGRHVDVGLVIKSKRVLLRDLLSQFSALRLQAVGLSLVVHKIGVVLQRLLVIALLLLLMLQLALVEGLVDHHHAAAIVLLLSISAVVLLGLGMEINLAHWRLLQVLGVALVQALIVLVLRRRTSHYDVRGLG
jgi:hypothetical protein